MQQATITPQNMNERDAAAYLGVSIFTLQRWRCERRGPAFRKLGRAVRYSPEALDEYLSNATVSPIA